MTNEVILSHPTGQLLFDDHAGDFGAAPTTPANTLIIGAPTDIQINLTGIAAAGGARQSAKSASLGPRPPLYTVDACVEFETAPADGGTVDFWWGGSGNATAATGNPAGLTGTDAAFTDTSGNLGELQLIGSLAVRNNVIAIGEVGFLMPRHQYGILVVVNNASTALRSTATAMDETHITFTPVTYGTA